MTGDIFVLTRDGNERQVHFLESDIFSGTVQICISLCATNMYIPKFIFYTSAEGKDVIFSRRTTELQESYRAFPIIL